ncbi:hypothetical protein N7449_009521 [Penicillium cf. viridicatum]|uniref:Uncharacterized protein n=1 Tax=Penicillium cf. viridicatum TaxID=2972119 RepID=A0A9W9JA79_9EURO|nr:hypothetical protein N7449_009521 [Penicillium cf. viridicatum]
MSHFALKPLCLEPFVPLALELGHLEADCPTIHGLVQMAHAHDDHPGHTRVFHLSPTERPTQYQVDFDQNGHNPATRTTEPPTYPASLA